MVAAVRSSRPLAVMVLASLFKALTACSTSMLPLQCLAMQLRDQVTSYVKRGPVWKHP